MSVMVLGLDDWDTSHALPLGEERLLAAVREELGPQVAHLYQPPLPQEGDMGGGFNNPFDLSAKVGIPVAPFPGWVLCPRCCLLAPLSTRLFSLKTNPYRLAQNRHVHTFCNSPKPPAVLPARFLVACKNRALDEYERKTFEAHKAWRHAQGIIPSVAHFPVIRYVLLHSFSHALMRQLAIECGYTAASIRERIYSKPPEAEDGPMAGVLLYTAAPDSEGTLGGLVSLSAPAELGRHINQALEQMSLCASDPLCAEHDPFHATTSLHWASCHACLFSPETSCERGNKYLDRALLTPTVKVPGLSFFK